MSSLNPAEKQAGPSESIINILPETDADSIQIPIIRAPVEPQPSPLLKLPKPINGGACAFLTQTGQQVRGIYFSPLYSRKDGFTG